MRISDWSSDVCSSDLVRGVEAIDVAALFDDIDAAVARDGGDIERLVEPRSDALHRDPLAAVGDGDVDRLRRARAGVADAELDGIDIVAVGVAGQVVIGRGRSEEHTSELQSLMRNSYAVFCLKKKKQQTQTE